ncbi:MAG: uroporphyrinogen-III synthase [Erythrobacter sp.]
MTHQIIAVRPEPSLSATLELAQELALPLQGFALSRAHPCDWTAPDPADFDAILAGSGNAFRHGGAQLAKLTSLPVFAVGAKTAEAAVETGFRVSLEGQGGLQVLIDSLGPGAPERLLRLSGKDHVTLNPPEQVSLHKVITYRMEQISLTQAQADLLQQPAIIMLYSASSAAHFREQCEQFDVDIAQITIAALGPRIAKAAGNGWAAVHASDKPSEAELLALAIRLWQLKPNASPGGGAEDE